MGRGFVLFLVKLSLLSIAIVVCEYWLFWLLELPLHTVYHSSLIFFIATSILIYLIHSIGFRQRNSDSISFFTAATIIKLVLSGGFLFIVLGFYPVQVITFVSVFFSIYSIYTFFELYVLINERKKIR